MTLPPQIHKLIPRLSSNHEGEVVATVAAIGRVLAAAGSDWDAVAAACVPNTGASTSNQDEGGGFSLRARDEMRSARTDIAKAMWLVEYGGFWLRQREKEFVADLARDLAAYRGSPTFKQRQWLNALFDRLRRAVL